MNDRHNQNGAVQSADEALQAQLTAYALGQLNGEERAQVEALLGERTSGAAQAHVDEVARLASQLKQPADSSKAELAPSAALRELLLARLDGSSSQTNEPLADTKEQAMVERSHDKSEFRPRWLPILVVGGILALAGVLVVPAVLRNFGQQTTQRDHGGVEGESRVLTSTFPGPSSSTPPSTANGAVDSYSDSPGLPQPAPVPGLRATREHWGDNAEPSQRLPERNGGEALAEGLVTELSAGVNADVDAAAIGVELQEFGTQTAPRSDLGASVGGLTGSGVAGRGEGLAAPVDVLRQKQRVLALSDGTDSKNYYREAEVRQQLADLDHDLDGITPFGLTAEQYDAIIENAFLSPTQQPLSTFSIDVDTASYANVRRFLTTGRLPPPNAVRIEELVNYFPYNYPQPEGDQPFSVNLEMAECPWNQGHRLLRVGLKGKDVHRDERPMSNLVFLLDVSGSMDEPNKLPLVKQSMSMLVQELTENDRVSIVTYAGNAGLVLPPTSGDQKRKILDAIEALTPGGSTHGSAGIQLAYDLAKEYFRKDGTNRVILATDGDLNVGVTSDEALVELITEKAKDGTFLTVLGFGEGNLKDSKMEKLADNGNGIYAYIDGAREGRKVLVEQMTGSLITIAKDVKIQIEFNPAEITSYRLLGYENRVLAAKDFNDDKKDAGEIGAGHTVTALYEIVPVGAETKPDEKAEQAPETDPLKYQAAEASGGRKSPGETTDKPAAKDDADSRLTEAARSGELLTLKLRYKQPDGDTSKLLEFPHKDKGGSLNAASQDMQFAAAVASFGMILRKSEHRGTGNLAAVAEIASGSLGKDDGGYRAEFVDLVKRAQAMGVE